MEGVPIGSVLLAEAEAAVAKVVSARLDSDRVTVRWVRTLREARQELADNPPDLLLLDTALETDGLEFFQALRSRPDAPRGGVIVLAEKADVHARERAAQLGAAAVVTKPIDADDMARAVRELLDCL
jgi:two-component system, OmpR family, catabolic regulation response regulator CreB